MNGQILKFEPRRQPTRPLSPPPQIARGMERGVSERTVARCMQSIRESGLDLEACISKGGAWAVAARRIRVSAVQQRLGAELDSLRGLLDRHRPSFSPRLALVGEGAEED